MILNNFHNVSNIYGMATKCTGFEEQTDVLRAVSSLRPRMQKNTRLRPKNVPHCDRSKKRVEAPTLRPRKEPGCGPWEMMRNRLVAQFIFIWKITLIEHKLVTQLHVVRHGEMNSQCWHFGNISQRERERERDSRDRDRQTNTQTKSLRGSILHFFRGRKQDMSLNFSGRKLCILLLTPGPQTVHRDGPQTAPSGSKGMLDLH